MLQVRRRFGGGGGVRGSRSHGDHMRSRRPRHGTCGPHGPVPSPGTSTRPGHQPCKVGAEAGEAQTGPGRADPQCRQDGWGPAVHGGEAGLAPGSGLSVGGAEWVSAMGRLWWAGVACRSGFCSGSLVSRDASACGDSGLSGPQLWDSAVNTGEHGGTRSCSSEPHTDRSSSPPSRPPGPAAPSHPPCLAAPPSLTEKQPGPGRKPA